MPTYKSTTENKREILETIDGRKRYAVATPASDAVDVWDCEMEMPNGQLYKERKRLNSNEVSFALSNWLNSKHREFQQAKDRPSGATELTQHVSLPDPGAPVGFSYGRYKKD